MSTTAENTAIAVQEPARLDELMLAMDVVDTLRHQQDLVDHALSEDQRDAALIVRIKKIYADQGIEVSEAIIAEGVEALKKDRFLYQPPERGFARRLAHFYVDRGKWAKRVVAVGVIALAGWLVWDIQHGMAERQHVAEAKSRIDAVATRIDSIAGHLAQAQRSLQGISVPANAHEAGERIVADIRAETARAEQALMQVRAVVLPDPAAIDAGDLERGLAPLNAPLEEADQALTRADARLGDLHQLGKLADTLARTRAALIAADLPPAVRNELDGLRGQAEQALAAGDLPLARGRIDRLVAIAATVNQAYELRIVSRPNAQSGVWRHPADNRNARNYYIIVEAVGPDGRPMTLPITNEEDQTIREVSTFGLRVPEQVYEAVRADKQDNGLIDRPLFGEKRRGEIEPRYRYAVSGGAITSW
jgi:hypothetical protein